MVNNSSSISTTQSLDRLVGTAAIIGLSLAVVLQWLNSSDENDVLSEEEEGSNHPQQLQQEYESGTAAAAASSPSRRKIIDGNSKKATWWWPLTILQRRKKKRRKRQNNKHHENNNPRNIDGSCCNNTNEGSSSCGDDGYCDHLGSCECGSIRFILKGPKHLQPIQSPGKIQYPHIQTFANNFHLVQGEADMRFQYVQESNADEDYDNNNSNTTSGNNHHHGDDSSTIATEQHSERQYHQSSSSMGAHVFCGNCGVHVMHADRSSEELEVNANCLLEKESSSPVKEQIELQQQLQQQQRQIQQQTSSLSSLSIVEGDTATDPTTSTRPQQQQLNSVSEHELFLGSAQFLMELDDNNHSNTSVDNNATKKCQELENSQHARTESISSTGEQTHPESYTTMLDTPTYEGDDYSMDGSSSLVAPAGIGGGGASSSASVLSVNTAAGLLPPLPPSRLPPLSSSSDSKSVRTLPPWFGERPGYASHPSRSVGGGWSVASMETNDLDSVGGGGESTTVSPRMRDQMKFYMSRYMKDKKKSERSGSV